VPEYSCSALTLLVGLWNGHLACQTPVPLVPKGSVLESSGRKKWREKPANPGWPESSC